MVRFNLENEIAVLCKVIREDASYFHHNSIVRNENGKELYRGEEEFNGQQERKLEELRGLREATGFRNHLIAKIFITGINEYEEEKKWESYVCTRQDNQSNYEERNARVTNDFFTVPSRDRDFLETRKYIIDFVSRTGQPNCRSNFTYLYFPRTSDQGGEFWSGYRREMNNSYPADCPNFYHGDMSLFYALKKNPWLFKNLLRENRDEIEVTSTGVKIISTLDACNACHYAMIDQFGGIGGNIYNSLRRERNFIVNDWVPFYSLFYAAEPHGKGFGGEQCSERYDQANGNYSCYGIKNRRSGNYLISSGAYDTEQGVIFGLGRRDNYGRRKCYWTQLPQTLVSERDISAEPLAEIGFEKGRVNYCVLPFNENQTEQAQRQYQYQQARIIDQSQRLITYYPSRGRY
jgi:hypothetical protein